MQFYSRNRIGVNMSRCVWISQIYKYRNIVPIWGKNHSLLWMWEQYSSGPQCWQRWWGVIAKRPPHSLQLPTADALTWENVCISGSNYIHWGAEIKWWTMYQTKGIFQIMHWFFSSRKRSKVMLTMLWVQNTSKFGAPTVPYLKDSFVHMTWLTQKYVLPFPPGTCLLIKELTAEAWVRSFCYSPTGFKEEGRQKRESQLPVSDIKALRRGTRRKLALLRKAREVVIKSTGSEWPWVCHLTSSSLLFSSLRCYFVYLAPNMPGETWATITQVTWGKEA